jgi:drug/metabolite transporter, DME family
MSAARGSPFRQRTGLLLLILTGVIWGTIGITGRLVFDRTQLDALEVSWMRTLFAAPFCFLVGLRILGRRLFAVTGRGLLAIIGLAATNFAFQFTYLIGVDEIGVSVATLICLCSIPVIVAIVSIVAFGDRPSNAVIVALAGAVIGTGLLTIGQGGSQGNGNLALGIGASLGSAVGAAAYTLGSRALVQRYHPIMPLSLGLPFTLLIFAPVMRGGHVGPGIPVSGWALLVYLGVGTQGIAYLAFQWGLRTETATVASIVTLIEPVLAAFLAWIMFGEQLGLLGIFGAGMLIAGLVLLTMGPHPVRVRNDPIVEKTTGYG